MCSNVGDVAMRMPGRPEAEFSSSGCRMPSLRPPTSMEAYNTSCLLFLLLSLLRPHLMQVAAHLEAQTNQ